MSAASKECQPAVTHAQNQPVRETTSESTREQSTCAREESEKREKRETSRKPFEGVDDTENNFHRYNDHQNEKAKRVEHAGKKR